MKWYRGQINRNLTIGNYLDVGLKMINLQSFNKALKSAWVRKYLDPENHAEWNYFLYSKLQHLSGPAIFGGNLKGYNQLKYSIWDLFMIEILQIWSEVILGDPGAVSQFQVMAEEPMETLSYKTSSKRLQLFWHLIGTRKSLCFSAQSEWSML